MHKPEIVVGLTGTKGCGKDTLALHLVEHYGFTRLAFADKLYKEVSEAFSISVEELQNRETKETPQGKLVLDNCSNTEFVAVAIEVLVTSGHAGTWNELCRVPLSPRQVLQWWGTEYRREACGNKKYWLDAVFSQFNEKGRFVITDVRYSDELKPLVSEFGAITMRIEAPHVEIAGATALHPSETELKSVAMAHAVLNEYGKKEEFIQKACQLLKL